MSAPNIQTVVETYVAAWRERDAEARLRLLEQSWADDGVYVDPLTRTEGRAALSRMIGRYHQERPDTQVVLTSGVDHHHRELRFTWALLGDNGATLMIGMDFGQIAEDGRLQQITGFFGPMPNAPFEGEPTLGHKDTP